MHQKALIKILQEMNERNIFPDLQIGKLYYVSPIDTECQYYNIAKLGPSQKNSFYLFLIDNSHTPDSAIKARNDIHPLKQPVMILGHNLKSSDEKKYIDMLVGDKRYDKVVFEPVKMCWTLVSCENNKLYNANK